MDQLNRSKLIFFVNGKKVVEERADPELTLLQYLRTKLRLTGTKLGCGEGGCGACTVMVSRYDRNQRQIRHYSVNACLAPLCSMHGLAVTTVEGLGSTSTKLHPVQERLATSHGSQCGFCTPGIVMSMYTLLRNDPQPSTAKMERAFEGNLCRCTGYRPILEGFRSFTKEYVCGLGDKCCRNQATCEKNQLNGVLNGETENDDEESEQVKLSPYDPSQEAIFPSELQLTDEYDSQELVYQTDRTTWYRPTTLQRLLDLKAQYPDARLVIGNTEVGVEVKFKDQHYPVLIAATHVPELTVVQETERGLVLGGSVTLSTIEEELTARIRTLPEYRTRVFAAIVEMLRWFAGHQIRNVGAVAGNIMTASPISDLNPLFLAAGCVVTARSKDGVRSVIMDENFFRGYRKTALEPSEILLTIEIPFTQENEYFIGYKQAHRRDDDIAIVNAGMRVVLEPNNTISAIWLAFGGMAPITVMAMRTMKQLVGRSWNDGLVYEVSRLLGEELLLAPGTPGGMEPYRNTLTTSFFFKFYLSVLNIRNSQGLSESSIPGRDVSATSPYSRDTSHGIQVYEEPAPGQPALDLVGRPLPHLAADKQVTGEAVYVDDMPTYTDELYLALVLSSKAHADIVDIDVSEALATPGVHGYVGHKDVPGSNKIGPVVRDEELFASEKVVSQGQVIGAIVADNQMLAQRAAKKVKITYRELPPIITIEEAIQADTIMAPSRTITQGDPEAAWATCDHVVQGEVRVGGQEHFYLETNAAIVLPKEDGEMEIFCSSQNPTEMQMTSASILNVPANRILCRVKRMGGGFGGKETRYSPLVYPCIVAAAKFGRPVRCMLDRDEDMVATGTRHPFLGRYKVGFMRDGRLVALSVHLYANCGYSLDLSSAVVERAMFHIDNCYKFPNLQVKGYMCKTNTPTNTAFRGFGGPQGLLVCEYVINHVAEHLKVDAEKIRSMNMYEEGDRTHFNQTLEVCNIRRCWDECLRQGNYHELKQQVHKFNRENRWRKRGISIVPTKFGISFTSKFLNQAGALVHVYKDGSVLVAHGGTEMGQGLHTKMIQVASRVLQIPLEKIHISETSTSTVPNTSPTAASASSDLNGMAVKVACETILERLEPYRRNDPKGSWESWVTGAYFDRVSLSTTGFYRTPDIGYNFDKNEGHPFAYFTFGAACSMAEIDCLTGDHTVLRTDIVMDVGASLNPVIDIGQIEGGFMQGYGLFTLEEQRYSPTGFLYTRGPGMYKIPGFGDIPVELNVSLLKGSLNSKAVYSSKAIGEPPLFLAASVFFAIKNAIMSAREDAGLTGPFTLHSPATAERIRMACHDKFTQQFPEAEPGTYKPWFVCL